MVTGGLFQCGHSLLHLSEQLGAFRLVLDLEQKHAGFALLVRGSELDELLALQNQLDARQQRAVKHQSVCLVGS